MRPATTECYYHADGRLFYLMSGVFLGSYEHDFMFGWNGTDWNCVHAQESSGFFPMEMDGKIGFELKDCEKVINKSYLPAKPFSFEPAKATESVTRRSIDVNVAVLATRSWKTGTCEITAQDDGFFIGETFFKRGDAKSMRRELSQSKSLANAMRDVSIQSPNCKKIILPGTLPFPTKLGWEMKTRTAIAVAMAFLYERWYRSWAERKSAKSIVSLWPAAGTTVYARGYAEKTYITITLTMQ